MITEIQKELAVGELYYISSSLKARRGSGVTFAYFADMKVLFIVEQLLLWIEDISHSKKIIEL